MRECDVQAGTPAERGGGLSDAVVPGDATLVGSLMQDGPFCVHVTRQKDGKVSYLPYLHSLGIERRESLGIEIDPELVQP